ncbi:segregation/condensation protein A [Sodalinema gerasimenkoae]|uniref:segregation/condensation protein A n=1 Tax=Sodalinema gerasimenkoae TaxID=2862348 RepID=UPI001356D862|nr:ScpA family protein [Sodalinema gerasimenkoae]
MTPSLAQDAIELLLDLAERGEIDPWDVQVIDVIDRHLSHLAPSLSPGGIPYEADLSRSGQAFLYASMLLLLKADTLVRAPLEEEPEALDENLWLTEGESQQLSLPFRLETQLQRRAVAPPLRKRPVSLGEMIAQLETIAEQFQDDPLEGRSRRRRKTPKRQTAEEIGQLAHEENLTETAADIEAFLLAEWDKMTEGETWVSFDRLLERWTPGSEQHHSLAEQQVAVFWALLLLASQSKVELLQAQFYGQIQIKLIFESC